MGTAPWLGSFPVPCRPRGSALAAGNAHRRAWLDLGALRPGSRARWLLLSSLLWSCPPGRAAQAGLLPAWRLRETWSGRRDGPTCPADRFTFAGFFLVSGIYHLEPLVHTSQNAAILLTP